MVKLLEDLKKTDNSEKDGSLNPFGPEFGKIYKDLTGDELKKANAEIAKICYFMKKNMYSEVAAAVQKTRVGAKWFELSL